MRYSDRDQFTNLTNEFYSEPKDHSNLYLGIALGVMITSCAGIWVMVSVMEGLIK